MSGFAAELRRAAENGDHSYVSQVVDRLEESLCGNPSYRSFFGSAPNGNIRKIAQERAVRALFHHESFDGIERLRGKMVERGRDPVQWMVDYILRDEVCGHKACIVGPGCMDCKPDPLNEECEHYQSVPRELAFYTPG